METNCNQIKAPNFFLYVLGYIALIFDRTRLHSVFWRLAQCYNNISYELQICAPAYMFGLS